MYICMYLYNYAWVYVCWYFLDFGSILWPPALNMAAEDPVVVDILNSM